MRLRLRPLLAAAVTVVALSSDYPAATAAPAIHDAATVRTATIPTFRLNNEQVRFGKLDFVGGLVMESPNWLFGGLSAIRFRPNGRDFVMISDTGHWFTGQIERDTAGRLSGIAGLEVSSMVDRHGRREAQKYNMDSEGLALREGEAFVSFERRHQVDVYGGPDITAGRPVGSVPILMPRDRLSDNGSLETIAASPPSSPLAGGLVLVAEASEDDDGNLYAAILDGPRKGRFAVRHHDGFDVSDGTFLPNGDLLLLQRRFTIARGLAIRIVRIPAGDLRPGAVVDGEVILSADSGEQIDNMEGIDAISMPDGSTRLILISDDNHSLFQRSLMLEFRLAE